MEPSNEKTRWRDRVKNNLKANEIQKTVVSHWRDHKETYIKVGIAVVTAGFTCAIMRSNTARGAVGEGASRGEAHNTASFNFRNNQTINMTTVVEREGRGHPGWPVRNLETKRIDLSQKAAAEHFGIPERVLSGHLRGKFQDADGLHFERVNLTMD